MNFRSLPLLIAGSMLMLNASACKKEEAVKAEDKAAAPVDAAAPVEAAVPVEASADGVVKAEVALEQLDCNNFNHAALRLNLPLFCVYEAKANKTVRPEVLMTLNFHPASDSLKWKNGDINDDVNIDDIDDIDKAMRHLTKLHRIEFKNSDVKWKLIESDYPLPNYKISVDKDIAHELSLITKKTCERFADEKLLDGTGIQVFECGRLYDMDEAIVIYIGLVAKDDKIARIYRVGSEFDTMGEYLECRRLGDDRYLDVEFVDSIQSSWLDTTAYTIRIKSSCEQVHYHGCDSPCGCDVVNTYETLHSYVFAGNKFRPVADWREIVLHEHEDWMVGDYLYNKDEEECEELMKEEYKKCRYKLDEDGDPVDEEECKEEEYKKCRYKLDEDGNPMMDPEVDCPYRSLWRKECYKAILVGKDLSISEVVCK